MGNSPQAKLVYGYQLGGDDGGWYIDEVDGYGEIDSELLPWLQDLNGEDSEEFVTQTENRLLATIAGFTETDWQVDGFYARRIAARALLSTSLR